MASVKMTNGTVGKITATGNGSFVTVTGDIPNPSPPPAELEQVDRVMYVTDSDMLLVLATAKGAGGTVEVTYDDQTSNTATEVVWT